MEEKLLNCSYSDKPKIYLFYIVLFTTVFLMFKLQVLERCLKP